MSRFSRKCLISALLLLTLKHAHVGVNGKAILGVDLGSLYMKVALVQSGSPVQIVTNMHSKRKTEQMILFDRNGQRFYGADASSLLARKSQLTPAAMSLLLGRNADHPAVRVLTDRHYPLTPQFNESRFGVNLEVSGAVYSPEELVGMVLTHAVDCSVAYSQEMGRNEAGEKPKDLVLTVPSFATQHERLALMAAGSLVDLNVLTLMEENTAAAVQYATDKTFSEEDGGSQLLLLYNLGASSLQVSIVKFESIEHKASKLSKAKPAPCVTVVAKAWDDTLGGQAFDNLIVEHLADQFNHQWNAKTKSKNKDVRTVPRAMTKLRIQANKIKHVLSANMEIPVYMESLHDDVTLQSHMTRKELEELAHKSGLLKRAIAPVAAVFEAANLTAADLTGPKVELIGAGMRVPSVQSALQDYLGDAATLGFHMNADESSAMGAAFAGANISTAFRVRHIGLTDLNPFPMTISLSNLATEEKGNKKKKKKKGDDEEEWSKKATIFKAMGKFGIKKTLAFTHDKDVFCEVDYDDVAEDADPSLSLPQGTEKTLERYNVTGIAAFAAEMEEKGLGKPKVSLQFELSTSGIAQLVKAEATVQETYMANVTEEIEVDDEDETDEEENATDTKEGEDEAGKNEKKDSETVDDKDEAAANDTEASNDTVKVEDIKKKAKKKKTIVVEKEKKRTIRRTLGVSTYYTGNVQPLNSDLYQESRDKLIGMAKADEERMMLESSKNKLESYVYLIKNKLVDDEENINAVTTEKQREACRQASQDAEMWMEDEGYTADLATTEDKFAEISEPFEKILLRVKESKARPEMVAKAEKRVAELTEVISKWEQTKPQITEEERQKATDLVTEIKTFITDKEAEQAKKEPHEDPAYLSQEIPPKFKKIEEVVKLLNKRPKPRPKKNDTATTNSTGDENVTADENATASDESAATDEAANTPADDAGDATKDDTGDAKDDKIEDEL